MTSHIINTFTVYTDLNAALIAAVDGTSDELIILTGAPGVGKTLLLSAVERVAGNVPRGNELGQRLPIVEVAEVTASLLGLGTVFTLDRGDINGEAIFAFMRDAVPRTCIDAGPNQTAASLAAQLGLAVGAALPAALVEAASR